MHDFVMTGMFDEPMNIPNFADVRCLLDTSQDRMDILLLKMAHT